MRKSTAMMNNLLPARRVLAALTVCLIGLAGCPAPKSGGDGAGQSAGGAAGVDRGPAEEERAPAPAPVPVPATAKAEDVEAAKRLLDGMPGAKYTVLSGSMMTEIVIPDGSALTPQDVSLFGKLTDLETLQILNDRELNDKMAAGLAALKNLKKLALTNSTIGDATVELIAKSFPNLTELDLSSNTNMTNGALKAICQMGGLERLTLVQNNFNDIGTGHLESLKNLRTLDLRGNMDAGDMTLEIVARLPKLSAFKHRSTAVTDLGMEYLAESKTLSSLLMHDFNVTGQSGPYLAKLPSLRELEVFRCSAFGSDGVLALKGMKLTRLTLRDLPAVDDQAMEVFADLPELKRLYLHELPSPSDEGLKNLAALKSLELLDIWTLPQMGDATVAAIAGLPNLKELSIRTTGVTDAAVDSLLAMPNLRSLTFTGNGMVTPEGLKKLSGKKWSKLEIGSPESSESATP